MRYCSIPPYLITHVRCMDAGTEDAGTEETVRRKTVGRKTVGRKAVGRKTLGRQTQGRVWTEPHLLEYLIYVCYFLSISTRISAANFYHAIYFIP